MPSALQGAAAAMAMPGAASGSALSSSGAPNSPPGAQGGMSSLMLHRPKRLPLAPACGRRSCGRLEMQMQPPDTHLTPGLSCAGTSRTRAQRQQQAEHMQPLALQAPPLQTDMGPPPPQPPGARQLRQQQPREPLPPQPQQVPPEALQLEGLEEGEEEAISRRTRSKYPLPLSAFDDEEFDRLLAVFDPDVEMQVDEDTYERFLKVLILFALLCLFCIVCLLAGWFCFGFALLSFALVAVLVAR